MNLCKEVCLRVVAHLWSTKLAHLSASQFKNSNLSSCNMQWSGKECVKVCANTSKVAQLSGILGSFSRLFLYMRVYNVPFWDKMVHLSGMFIYPAVHLCGVHCIIK